MSRRTRKKTQADNPHITQEIPTVPAPGEPVTIPLIRESLQVDKEWVEAGAVVIRKSVESRTETVPVTIGYEKAQVERVPVYRVLAAGEAIAAWQERETLVIPVVQEELVVLKRRVVREEIRVSKQRLVRQEQVSDVVRNEQVAVETTGRLEAGTRDAPSA